MKFGKRLSCVFTGIVFLSVFLLNTPVFAGLDTKPPSIKINSPKKNSIFNSLGDMIQVDATASDNVGVTKMEIYFDEIKMAESNGAYISYGINADRYMPEEKTVTVKAFDAAGNEGESSVNVIISRLEITSPSNGAHYIVGQYVPIRAELTGWLSKNPKFFVKHESGNYDTLESDQSGNEFTPKPKGKLVNADGKWNTVGKATGKYTIRVQDAVKGNVTHAINIVLDPDTVKPTSSMEYSSNYKAGDTAEIVVGATDNIAMSAVGLWVNSGSGWNRIGKHTYISPEGQHVSFFWKVPKTPGTYQLKATAVDVSGNVGETIVSVNVYK